jgi:hypothetical protein
MSNEQMDIAKLNSGFPVEWFVNPPERTKCVFCRNILNDPRNCKSGHLFCSDCIQTTLKDDGTVECPTCKSSLNEKELTVHHFAQEAISELTTHCVCHSQNGTKGCGWTGMFKERADRICDFQLVDCSNCNEKVRKGNFDQHTISDCPARSVSCNFCNAELQHRELASHRVACIERPVKCTGCQMVMPLSKMEAHHDGDCVLNFIDCPLFKVGMCSAKCFGRVRVEDLETHASADAALTTRLVDEILKTRALLSGSNGEEEEDDSPRKRTRVDVEVSYNEAKFDDVETFSGSGSGAGTRDIYIDCLATYVSLSLSCVEVHLTYKTYLFQTTEASMRAIFSQYGQVTRVYRPKSEHNVYFA